MRTMDEFSGVKVVEDLLTEGCAVDDALGVLVVDDEQIVRTVIVSLLRAAGYRVWQADRGEQAIAIFRNNCTDIDVVLMDIGMTAMNGLQILSALRTIEAGVSCCLMTGDLARYMEAQIAESRPDTVLLKPFSAQQLKDVISTLAERALHAPVSTPQSLATC